MGFNPAIHIIVHIRKSYGSTSCVYYMKTELYNKLKDKPVNDLLMYCGMYYIASY